MIDKNAKNVFSFRINEITRLAKKQGIENNLKVLCDVGCDHGYVAFDLIKSGNFQRAVLVDVSKPSLEKAKKLFEENSKADACICYHSDGLQKIDEKIDLLIICGMGGMEIVKILSNDLHKIKNINSLILQPMRDEKCVREFLQNNGFAIKEDYLFVDDNKFYNLMCAEKGKQTLTEKQLFFGKTNLLEMKSDFVSYLDFQIGVYQRLLTKNLSRERKAQIEKQLKLMQEVKNGKVE